MTCMVALQQVYCRQTRQYGANHDNRDEVEAI
jgi:hypothetical protein